MLKEFDDNQKIYFYVWDYEYASNEDDATELGTGKFVNVERPRKHGGKVCINLAVNK